MKDRFEEKTLKRQERRKKKLDKAREELQTEGFQIAMPRKPSKALKPLNEAQGLLISTILERTITFVTGPAGTGKTYVTTALAAEKLVTGEIEKIVFCRPIKEVGESIGHLPGDLQEKYAPWIQPIVSVLEHRLGPGDVKGKMRSGVIQAIPLMHMRGMSFDNTWIILDEAQNSTPQQMLMLLTRIGSNSKLIVDGDLMQSDLEDRRGAMMKNGLEDALNRLGRIDEIGAMEFTEDDIVRNPLIKTILRRYR